MHDAGQGFRTTDPRMVGQATPSPCGLPGLASLSLGLSLPRTPPRWTVAQVTAFPSLLALAATFARPLARAYGAAVGREFRAKGANVMLGPQLNVQRVPRSGRAAESLSGAGPLLCAAPSATRP